MNNLFASAAMSEGLDFACGILQLYSAELRPRRWKIVYYSRRRKSRYDCLAATPDSTHIALQKPIIRVESKRI